MGKNKKPSISSHPTQPAIQLPAQKVISTGQQTAPLLEKAPPEWNAETIKNLSLALPEDKKTQLAAFMEQFAEWGTLLQNRAKNFSDEKSRLTQEHETLKGEISRQRHALDDEGTKQNQQFATRQKELDEKAWTIQAKSDQVEQIFDKAQAQQDELARQRNELIRREQEIVRREAELRNGLVMEREASLNTLREQVADLESRRNNVAQEIEAKRQQLLEKAAEDAARIRTEAEKLADEIRQREVALESGLTELARSEEKLRSGEELLKANRKSFTEHVQDALKHEREGLQNELTKLRKRLEDKSEEVDRLQQELADLDDLREAAGADPGQLVSELERLRRDNRSKDRELADLRSRAELDDPAELRQQRDNLQQQLDEKSAELEGLKAREGDWQRSVTAQQDWEKTRQVMERGRTLLHSETERLRLQVDDLMSRQQASAVFPALKAMDGDSKLQLRTHTDEVPNLAHLVKDLQARLYWATPEKPLFFQEDVLQLFLGGLAMSQLHVFQGISGTGKTSLATAFAEAIGGEITTVAVQAGWRDRADLLGYYNAFEKRFYERNTLQALYRAQTEADKDRVHIVLLDEMNLSRPEQYFADFLSAMEMDGEQRRIDLMDSAIECDHPILLNEGKSIDLPKNVWFIGTANQDETTHAFADKTHDRAFVLDLPRWENTNKNPEKPKMKITWSFSSLMNHFDQACEKFHPRVNDLIRLINASELTETLAEDFQLGWGNRLERQLKRFVPVVIEVGGSEALAVDHLLQSRMFRDGKVVGRHDVQVDDLKRIEDLLRKMWNECKLEGEPTRCLAAIARDIKRLERGG